MPRRDRRRVAKAPLAVAVAIAVALPVACTPAKEGPKPPPVVSGESGPPVFAVVAPSLTLSLDTTLQDQGDDCGVTASGRIYCWRLTGGILDLLPKSDPCAGNPSCLPAPPPIPTDLVWAQVAAARCAVTQTGVAWCWGDDTQGQLGDGQESPFAKPARIGGKTRFAMVSGGNAHTCALDTNGAAWCWGRASDGQLGSDAANPTVPGRVLGGLRFVSLGAGGYHSCGVDTAGAAWCWGSDTTGQVGDGRTPAEITAHPYVTAPVPVVGGHVFQVVTTGASHTCALTPTGRAWCWGAPGTLGNPNHLKLATSKPVAVAGDHHFVAISAGQGFTCAVDTAGVAWCWGLGDHGQLGDGNLDDFAQDAQRYPTRVLGGLRFESIAAGVDRACGVTVDGDAYCWGAAYQAHPKTTYAGGTTPVLVAGNHTFAPARHALFAP